MKIVRFCGWLLLRGAAWGVYTLVLVSQSTLLTLVILATNETLIAKISNEYVWRVTDLRVRAVESNVRALMLAAGAQVDGPTYGFPDWDAAAARACADPFGGGR